MRKLRTGSRRRKVFAAAALATALVAVAAGVAQSATSSKKAEIVPAPAFTASDLASPSSSWSTNGGSLMNQRYSPLTQINTGNVSKLKAIWETHVGGLGKAAKYSGEGQPVYWKGVLYVTTGNDDVSAISVKTGKIIWKHQSHITQKISTVCCGWLNRGIGLGAGLVYVGQLDGKVVALSQSTGEMVWSKQLVKWQQGATITGAPLYLDGKLYIGVVGADFGFRAFLQQIDAKTGKLGWRFYTIPAPNQPGGDTWPKGSNAYLRGGASVWSTPAVDPKLGLMYFTTGNAGNDWYGGNRAGKNLYASSIVALQPEHRHDDVGVPGGAPRHLGLRHPEPGDPVQREDLCRQAGAGDRRAGQDRLAVPAEPRERQAAVRDHGEAGAAEQGPEDVADAADSPRTRSSSHMARRRRPTSSASRRRRSGRSRRSRS